MTYWNDSLLTGVTLIDNEHRKLVAAIDRLMDACNQGKGMAEIAQVLSFAVTYAKEHIRDEENLQEKYAYPGLNAHKRSHTQFIMSTDALVKEFEEKGLNIALIGKLNKTLVNWLTDHISKEDKKMGEYIQKKTTRWRME